MDLFNPNGVHPVKIEAFTGPNGTGDLLGSFNAAGFNFQKNKLYFMGIVSTDRNVGSVRITVTGGAGDVLGIDDFLFAAGGTFCHYTLRRDSVPQGGCQTCPVRGDTARSGTECENTGDCPKKIKGTIGCPGGGPGVCKKVKGKRTSCE